MIKNDSILYLTVTDQRHNRIADIIGPAGVDAANPINDFTCTLNNLFRNVISYDYLKNYIEKGVRKTNSEICILVKKEKPQYVLWRAHDYQILESTLQTTRETGSIVIAWFWDDHFRFDNYARLYIPSIDYSITTDPDAIDKYNLLGARCLYSPGGCAGEHYKELDLPKKFDVSFVGSNVWGRNAYIQEIKRLGIEVATFGSGWNSGKISFDQMLNTFNSSKINLNFSGVGSNGAKQLKGRIFEIAMCRGFLLTEYVPGVERFFVVDKEIACFETIEEAVEKIEYYLEHEREREAIAQAGRNRAIREYTWSKILPRFFEEIEQDIAINDRSNISSKVVEIPQTALSAASFYHCTWAKAWFIENRLDLSKEELEVSLKYSPGRRRARRLSLILRLPNPIRAWMFYVVDKCEQTFSKVRNKLQIRPKVRSILRHFHF